MYYYYESWPSLLLFVLGFLICMFAQIKISSTYSKYKKIKGSIEKTGEDVANEILKRNGLDDIQINCIAGNLTDHYSPSRKEINLSEDVYSRISIASLAVAAHECGHAIQKKENYAFYNMRTALIPVVNVINYMGYIGLIISLFTGYFQYVEISLIVVFATLVFQLITLPVEFDASRRGKAQLVEMGYLTKEEEVGVSKVLSAAAFTYVAGVISSLLQVMRILLILGRRRRD